MERKFYQKNWFIVIMLIVAPPIGTILALINPFYPSKPRKIIGGFLIAITLFAGIKHMMNPSEPNGKIAEPNLQKETQIVQSQDELVKPKVETPEQKSGKISSQEKQILEKMFNYWAWAYNIQNKSGEKMLTFDTKVSDEGVVTVTQTIHIMYKPLSFSFRTAANVMAMAFSYDNAELAKKCLGVGINPDAVLLIDELKEYYSVSYEELDNILKKEANILPKISKVVFISRADDGKKYVECTMTKNRAEACGLTSTSGWERFGGGILGGGILFNGEYIAALADSFTFEQEDLDKFNKYFYNEFQPITTKIDSNKIRDLDISKVHLRSYLESLK